MAILWNRTDPKTWMLSNLPEEPSSAGGAFPQPMAGPSTLGDPGGMGMALGAAGQGVAASAHLSRAAAANRARGWRRDFRQLQRLLQARLKGNAVAGDLSLGMVGDLITSGAITVDPQTGDVSTAVAIPGGNDPMRSRQFLDLIRDWRDQQGPEDPQGADYAGHP